MALGANFRVGLPDPSLGAQPQLGGNVGRGGGGSRTRSLDTTDSWTHQLSDRPSSVSTGSRETGVRIHLPVTSTGRNTQEAELLLSLSSP